MFEYPLGLLLIVLIVVAVIFVIVKSAQAHAERERQRLAGLNAWAGLNGFEFSKDDPWDLDARYRGVGDIGNGHARYAYEVLFRQGAVPVAIFNYRYKTWE